MTGQVRARWEDAYDLLVHLHDEIRSQRLRIAIDREVIPLYELKRRLSSPEDRDIQDTMLKVGIQVLVNALGEIAARAEPVYVSDDVYAIWREASAGFQPEPIDYSDPITATALVLLPDVVRLTGEDRVGARALLWTNRLRYDDERAVPGLMVAGLAQLGDLEAECKPEQRRLPVRARGAWFVSSQTQLPVGCTPYEHERRNRETLARAHGQGHELDWTDTPITAWREAQSLWRLARTFVPARERPSRATRRAGRRAQLDASDVTVIRLRRKRRAIEQPRDVDWTCRWIVRGHWRRLKDGRQVYVVPYVKGPEGLPLRVTRRAWEFVR